MQDYIRAAVIYRVYKYTFISFHSIKGEGCFKFYHYTNLLFMRKHHWCQSSPDCGAITCICIVHDSFASISYILTQIDVHVSSATNESVLLNVLVINGAAI